MTGKPNFLLFMTDQHCADWLGCYGHPVVRTPNIDALAARGTRFTDFHVASPVCMPNRASFMTGRFPSVHGLRYNGCLLPESANTFVDVLKADGYRTASIGKSHLQPMTDLAPHEWGGKVGKIAEAWKTDGGQYEKESPARYEKDGKFEFPTPYYGFDHVDMVTGHGDRAGGHYAQWFRETHENWQDLTNPENELPHDYTCPQAYRTPIGEQSYSTSFIRDKANAYLRARESDDTPFFAFVSFPDPHHPFNPPGKYWDMYKPEQFDLSTRFGDHKNPPPPLLAAKRAYDAGETPKAAQTAFMASDRQIQEAMALTAGMITMIDDAIGEIIETLKESGQFDDTVIIFTSDHGDYLGDSNLLLKGAWARETTSRVPMIWAEPAGPEGTVSPAMASTIDISASILDRADLLPYAGMQGESFLHCVQGAPQFRDSLLIEYNDGLARMGFDRPARVRTVINKEWRLSVYNGLDWGELYHRVSDRNQVENLWDVRQHRDSRSEMMSLLSYHLIGMMDESPRGLRLA